MTIHYKDKIGNIYGYKPDDIEVIELSDAEFEQLKAHQEAQFEVISQLQQKRDRFHAIETQIQRYERIKKRTETEEQELDALIDQATVLFREIKAEEGESQ